MSLPIFPVLPGLTFTVVKTPSFSTLDEDAPNGYEVRIPQMTNPLWKYILIYDFLHDFFWGSFATVSELRTLMGFFNAQGGKANSFLFTDPDDNYVGLALSTKTWTALTIFPIGFGILDSANHWQKVTAITTGITGATIPTFNHSGGNTTDAGVTWTDQGAYTSSGYPNIPLAQLSLATDGIGNWYSPIQRTLDGVFYEDVTDLNGAITVYLNGTLQVVTTNYSVGGPGLALPTNSYMGMYLKWVNAITATWIASHSYAVNAEIIDPAGHIQKVTTAGTSGTTIPTFNDAGSTTTDNTVTWTDQGYNPSPTGPVTAQFHFYFRVRFGSDSQDFEKFLNTGSAAAATITGQGGGIWTIGGSESQNGSGTLILRTARPDPL